MDTASFSQKKETYFGRILSENLRGGESGLSDSDCAGINSWVLRELNLKLLIKPVYKSIIQKLRKIPDVKIEVKGPTSYGGIYSPAIEYEERYHFNNLELRLEAGLEPSFWSVSDEVNRQIIVEHVDFIEWWNLFKKIK